MKKNIVFFLSILFISITAHATEIVTEHTQTFGFTSNGYYCKADLTFQWEYSGSDLEFYKHIKENVSGYIEARLKVLVFEDISTFSNLQLQEASKNGQLAGDSKIILDLIEKVNKEMEATGSFRYVYLNSLDINIVEMFETSIMQDK